MFFSWKIINLFLLVKSKRNEKKTGWPNISWVRTDLISFVDVWNSFLGGDGLYMGEKTSVCLG